MALKEFTNQESDRDVDAQTSLDIGESVVDIGSEPKPEVRTEAKPTGGLTAVAPERMTASQQAYNKYQKAIADLNTALEKRLSPESDSGKWFALAEAFLSPTATGHFGESVGKGAKALREAKTSEDAKMMQLAQMRAELAKGEYEMAGQKDAMDYIQRKYLGQTTTPITITKDDLPSIAKVLGRAEDDPTLQTLIGAPRNLFITPSGQSVMGGGSGFKVAPDVVEQLMATYGNQPQKVLEKLFELEKEFMKPTDMQRDMQALIDPNTPAIIKQAVAIKYLKDGVTQIPVVTDKGKQFFSINELLAQQGITLPQTALSGKAPSAGAPSAGAPAGGTTTTVGSKAGASGFAPGSEQDINIREARLKEESQEVGKVFGKQVGSIYENDGMADSRINTASRMIELTKTNPNAFGIFADKGLLNAIGVAVQEGLRVGNYSVSLPAEEFAKRLSGKVKKEDLNAAMEAASLLAQIELDYSQMFLKGGGQITEGERAIVRRIGGSLSESPEVLRLKAEAIRLKSEQIKRQRELLDQYYDEYGDSAPFRKFTASKAYKDLNKEFNDRFANLAEPKKSTSEAKSGESLAERIDREKRERQKGNRQ